MEFPVGKLTALEEKISSPRWVVPVLPDQELEILLNAAIAFASQDRDALSPSCQRFYREGLTISFNKLLQDDAVTSWKPNIQQCIRNNCDKLVKLCTLRMDDPHLLNILAVLFNPNNKFHSFNSSKQSEVSPEEVVYAKSIDHRNPRGWLVDLINLFGYLDGFDRLIERYATIVGLKHSPISEEKVAEADSVATEEPDKTDSVQVSESHVYDEQSSSSGSIDVANTIVASEGGKESAESGGTAIVTQIWQLIRPFGLCHEMLTPHTINKYIMPLLETIPDVLERLSDDELKKEALQCSNENKTDTVACLVRAAKCLASKAERNSSLIKGLEMFRLKMILRLLQMPSFNGKMSALNEVNQLIGAVSHQSRPDCLTPQAIAQWIKENNVLEIVLRDSLHVSQYVERLEKLLRFMVREGVLGAEDLDAVWNAQHGKHEAIVKNVHDLLAKLAWDFNPDQLDHLFDCFKASWSTSSKKQSDKLLEVIRRLAEDDKDGVMAHKVLVLFWNMAHSKDISADVMDVALANHVKILEYSCCQDRDAQKTVWLDKCVEELKASEHWALPALKQMREICLLYDSGAGGPVNAAGNNTSNNLMGSGTGAPGTVGGGNLGTTGGNMRITAPYRQAVIERLQRQHSLVILVTNSLTSYMDKARILFNEKSNLDWDTWLPDGRYTHAVQVQERLNFLRFLLKDGQLWLCAEQAKQIWVCLAERSVSPSDREACFKWFSKLMGEEPDLDPGINMQFFTQNILTLDPHYLTHSGVKCFERFFKAVNIKEGHLRVRRRGYQMEEADLIGLDYLWRIICECNEEIALCGVEMMRVICSNPGGRLSAAAHHQAFTAGCYTRLQHATQALQQATSQQQIDSCLVMLCRVLRVLIEYVESCDTRYSSTWTGERVYLPLYRASRGRHCSLAVRIHATQRPIDDIHLYAHSNQTLHDIRNNIHSRIRLPMGGSLKLELCHNGEILDSSQDHKLLSDIKIYNKTTLTGKVCPSGVSVSGQSSNDSSSDSSIGTPPPPPLPETALPGVILSVSEWQIPFMLELEQLATERGHMPLRDAAHQLTQLLPAHFHTMQRLSVALVNEDSSCLHQMFYGPSPPTVAYNVQVLYSMLMPAADPMMDRLRSLQLASMHHSPLFIDAVVSSTFLQGAADYLLRNGNLYMLKLVKLVLTALGYLLVMVSPDSPLSCVSPTNNNAGGNTSGGSGDYKISRCEVIREALQSQVNQNCEDVKAVAESLAKYMADEIQNGASATSSIAAPLLSRRPPSTNMILTIASHALTAAPQQSTCTMLRQNDVIDLARESLEVVTLCIALNGGQMTTFLCDAWWQELMMHLIVMCPIPQIRMCCCEQLLVMCSWGEGAGACPALSVLLQHAGGAAHTYSKHATQYFQLLCRLLARAGSATARRLLPGQVSYLQRARTQPPQDPILLEGHLNLTKEIFQLLPSEIKYEYGSNPEKDHHLIEHLVCEFLWPCSWAQLQLRQGNTSAVGSGTPTALCNTPGSIAAACDLLTALCYGCVPNMTLLTQLLDDCFYSDSSNSVAEWEYLPVMGGRAPCGLVGLKNAGATCYMNSVLQQLYMVPAIRERLLTVQGAAVDPNEDFSGEREEPLDFIADENTDYNVVILKQVQAIFAHLHYSKLQCYVPRGLWANFKLQGEPVNLREQQDAVEFFMSLVESLDEALKRLNQEQLMSATLGGSFSDQKICKGCPHRYCKEEPFSVVSLDIRNMCRLQESLEAYVRGELLEGADAYHCDKCNTKVVTVKRLCLNKLPPVLAIQLKRFEYDFEKVCAIKFNDYFEFPRDLDVEPYTAWGLAKAEGDASLLEGCVGAASLPCTQYTLTGIVVHSGQASGGHYYSYILHRDAAGYSRWVKFDDGDVTECGMQDDEEMKAQCFGGDYMGEVFDPLLKRVSYRRQKRWWNAYMLFYTRQDHLNSYNLDQLISRLSIKEAGVPQSIWECVRRSNIAFSHHQSQFSPEYFNFMKNLCYMRLFVGSSPTQTWGPEQEELSMLCVKLATKFLFNIAFRTKKSLRGSTGDWFEILRMHLRCSASIRSWFATNAMFSHPHRMCEYLLVCPSSDVRMTYMRLVVFLAHFAMQDPPLLDVSTTISPGPASSLSEQLLSAVITLATSREATEHVRHLPVIFTLFQIYAMLGTPDKLQLIKLNVISLLVSLSIDETTQSNTKYQYPEAVKLHQVVSILVRCCDVSSRCQSSEAAGVIKPNPYADQSFPEGEPRPQLPLQCADAIYNKTSYVKKLIEESLGCEEAVKLVQFLAWENPVWSRVALGELLWQVAYAYYHDLQHHADLLLALLLLQDSWQAHRIHNAIKGDDRHGLLDNIGRSRGAYQKRAYQCIKLLVSVFNRSHTALKVLRQHKDLRRKWITAVRYLQEELDRQKFEPRAYSYSLQPLDSTSGYLLERSNSTKKTLERAFHLCPDDEEDEEDDDVCCTSSDRESGGEERDVHTSGPSGSGSGNANLELSGEQSQSPQGSAPNTSGSNNLVLPEEDCTALENLSQPGSDTSVHLTSPTHHSQGSLNKDLSPKKTALGLGLSSTNRVNLETNTTNMTVWPVDISDMGKEDLEGHQEDSGVSHGRLGEEETWDEVVPTPATEHPITRSVNVEMKCAQETGGSTSATTPEGDRGETIVPIALEHTPVVVNIPIVLEEDLKPQDKSS